MSNKNNKIYIAGWKSITDWKIFKKKLSDYKNIKEWEVAYSDYFLERIKKRYIEPIRVLQENGTFSGEGFSILTIHCSLIEFLETTYQGLKYRYLGRGQKLKEYEYNISSDIFQSFLCNRIPFNKYFNKRTAEYFYKYIRCGLFHEAQTKGGWRIYAKSHKAIIMDTQNKIIYRNNFQDALEKYLEYYKEALLENKERKKAFIRKFDSLCT